MTRLAGFALVCVVALSLACSGVRVRTDYDPAIDFTPLQTYTWLDAPLREASREEGGQNGDPFTQNTLLDKRVRDEVDAWLASHGYRAAGEGEDPDFLVRYELVAREVTRDSPVFVTGGYGYGYGHGYGYGSGVGYAGTTTYQEGTLILDVIDPATQQISWRGYGISQTRDFHMEPERIHRSVAAILERFPPKKKSN